MFTKEKVRLKIVIRLKRRKLHRIVGTYLCTKERRGFRKNLGRKITIALHLHISFKRRIKGSSFDVQLDRPELDAEQKRDENQCSRDDYFKLLLWSHIKFAKFNFFPITLEKLLSFLLLVAEGIARASKSSSNSLCAKEDELSG